MSVKLETFNGLVYAITLSAVVSLIMLEAWFFKIFDPTWAIISGVVCTELELDQARSLILGRIIATIIGVLLALLMLISLGPGYITIISGVILVTLFCHYSIHLGNHWKLATATGAMILIAGLHQHSVSAAETIAFKRAAEVALGSITAGIVSVTLGSLWANIKRL